MKESRHDDERLAALLGGRLEGPEREEVLAHLLADDEDYQVFADTAAILQEAEDDEAAQSRHDDEQAKHPPVRDRRPPFATPGYRRWKAPRVIVPAVLAGLVALMIGVSRRDTAGEGPIRLAARLEQAAAGLPSGWADERIGSDFRGDGTAAEGNARAAYAGALLTDLAVAIQARNTVDVQRLVGDLKAFDRLGGGALDTISLRAGEPADALGPLLADATERLEERLEPKYLRLGAWIEAARLAAIRHDAGFFADPATRKALRRAERLTKGDAPARAAVERVRAALPAEGSPDWNELPSSLRTLLDELVT